MRLDTKHKKQLNLCGLYTISGLFVIILIDIFSDIQLYSREYFTLLFGMVAIIIIFIIACIKINNSQKKEIMK